MAVALGPGTTMQHVLKPNVWLAGESHPGLLYPSLSSSFANWQLAATGGIRSNIFCGQAVDTFHNGYDEPPVAHNYTQHIVDNSMLEEDNPSTPGPVNPGPTDVAVVFIGTNDAGQRNTVDIELEYLVWMGTECFDLLDTNDIDVLVISPPAYPFVVGDSGGNDGLNGHLRLGRTIMPYLRNEVQSRGYRFIDLYKLTQNSSDWVPYLAAETTWFNSDGIHLSAYGNTRLAGMVEIELNAIQGVTSGDLVPVGDGLVTVATNSGGWGDEISLATEGALTGVRKVSADAWDAGDRLFFDGANALTDTITANKPVAVALADAGAAETTCSVLLGAVPPDET